MIVWLNEAAGEDPALIERTIKGPKAGRVLLWTTPLSYNTDLRAADAWNQFPVTNWSFMVMMWQAVPYLSGATSETLNFEAGGDPVMLTLDRSVHYKDFTLVGPGPDGKATPLQAPASRGDTIEVPVPQQQPGQWTVKAMADGNRPAVLGFSLNPPHDESKFAVMETRDLDAVFGKDGYVFAEDAAKLKEVEATAKYGFEIFPFLMFLILIVVTIESILANTFYKEAPRANAAGAAA